MKRAVFLLLAGVVIGVLALVVIVTRDGERVVPEGEGTVTLDAGTFEAFPLPDYAGPFVTDDYESYLVEVEPGMKIHVLEVGSGFPVFMQHGNPTSGALYRKVVERLPTERVRVILPTLAGLGFSTKVPASEHTLENHIRWIHGVLEQLHLTELAYVGQDWGGPVGMGALARSPELLRGAVVMNTWFTAPTEQGDLSPAHALVRNPVVGEVLLEGLVSIFDGLQRQHGVAADVAEFYERPLTESGNIKAPVAMMRMVPDGPDHPSSVQLREIEAYVDGLDVPAEIVWGMSDPIFGDTLPAMKQTFPDARVTETDAGHFLQEDASEEIAAAAMRVVDQIQCGSPGCAAATSP